MTDKWGLCTIAFNGYGKHLQELCENVEAINEEAIHRDCAIRQFTIVLGKDHGAEVQVIKALYPSVKIIVSSSSCLGTLWNLAIGATDSEWVIPMDVDDKMLLDGASILNDYTESADYLSAACRKILSTGVVKITPSRVPYDAWKAKLSPTGRINSNSPFRKAIWEANPYPDNDWPNLMFVALSVAAGARFVVVPEPVSVYNRRGGNFSSSKSWSSRKSQIRENAYAANGIISAYYQARSKHG